MTFFHNDNYDWSGLIQQLSEQEQEQPEPTTTTTTTPYEFLPEIWNKIKEYAVPKKYEYDEEDCVYKVEIYRFLETIEDSYEKEHNATTKMIVETNGDTEDTCITFRDAITGRYIDELLWTKDFLVNDGCCKPMFSNWLRAEFMLSDLMPEDLYRGGDDEWVTDDCHYTDLKLVIELAEKGNIKYLVDPEDPENPIHTYGHW